LEKAMFMNACREGGRQIEGALRSLDRAYFGLLHRDCLRAVHDSDAARDLVQETFIKVWQRCATFRGESELLPWIRSICRHLILDRLRQPQREVPLDLETGMTPETQARVQELSMEQVPVAEDAVKQHQLAACFERCWDKFLKSSPEHALVIAWIAEDNLTHEQIAALLGRSPGATREFISQCRKRARLYLADWYALAFLEG
jgi:RNA polymerase sigma-70 factor (ECF subfamily)